MEFPAAANAQLSRNTRRGNRAVQATRVPLEHANEGPGLTCEHGTASSQLPSEQASESTGLPFEHPSEGTGLPFDHASEGSQLPFVHWMLGLHMDKLHQSQLLHAWLSAGRGPAIATWQSFLAHCSHAQVMRWF